MSPTPDVTSQAQAQLDIRDIDEFDLAVGTGRLRVRVALDFLRLLLQRDSPVSKRLTGGEELHAQSCAGRQHRIPP